MNQITKTISSRILRALARVFKVAVLFRLTLYKTGYLKKRKVRTFTISVGNITTGGTGKTPFVGYIAKFLVSRGYRPAVISRGYRRAHPSRTILITEGKSLLTDVLNAGDEPLMLAHQLDHVIIAVGADRFSTARWLEDSLQPDVFILDDAFQHIKLERDIDILLIDALDPFGKDELLPLGRLREPKSGISRASAIVVTRSDHPFDSNQLEEQIYSLAPKIPIFYSFHEVTQLVNVITGQTIPPTQLYGLQVAGFCAIGNPEVFLDDLKHFGAQVACFKALRDHHHYTQKEVMQLYQAAERANVSFLVTTEKDWLKLERLKLPRTPPLLVTRIQARVANETSFQNFLMNRLPCLPTDKLTPPASPQPTGRPPTEP